MHTGNQTCILYKIRKYSPAVSISLASLLSEHIQDICNPLWCLLVSDLARAMRFFFQVVDTVIEKLEMSAEGSEGKTPDSVSKQRRPVGDTPVRSLCKYSVVPGCQRAAFLGGLECFWSKVC